MTTSAPALTPAAWQLLRQLARPTCAAVTGDLDGRDWMILARLAAAGGTAPWVLANLQALGMSPPPQALALLRRGQANILARTLEADRTLALIAPQLLDGNDPPCLLFKGRAVERRAYPSPLQRPSVDVDIVPRPDRAAEAAARLRGLGLRETVCSPSGHVVTFAGPGGSSVVELHHRPLCPLRFGGLGRRSSVAELFARAVRGQDGWLEPHPIDHTAILLVHLTFGLYGDLRHLADVGMWLRALHPEPRAVAETLRAWQAQRAGTLALAAVRDFDPDAVQASWTTALPQRQHDSRLARLARAVAAPYHRQQVALPNWLDGAGVLAHTDKPLMALGRRLRPPRLDGT